jgi:predicted kinase
MSNPHGLSNALPARVASPFAATLRQRLRRVSLAIWCALEAHGRMRAMRELHDLAERCEAYDPERAQQLRSAYRFLAGRTP